MKFLIVSISISLLIGFCYPVVNIYHLYLTHIYSLNTIPKKQMAIVFGAGLKNGKPSEALKARVYTTVDLYRRGKVDGFLFSGDGKAASYNEPHAMQELAVALGVPKNVILLDPLGLNTYSTCQRAKQVYHIEAAVLVTQSYHLPRSLYYCTHSGIKAIGIPAEAWFGISYLYGLMREGIALNLIWWQEFLGFSRFNRLNG